MKTESVRDTTGEKIAEQLKETGVIVFANEEEEPTRRRIYSIQVSEEDKRLFLNYGKLLFGTIPQTELFNKIFRYWEEQNRGEIQKAFKKAYPRIFK